MRRTDAIAVAMGSVLAVSVLATAVGLRASAPVAVAAYASPPPDALTILWADYCGRVEDTRCLTPTPSPSATGTSPASTGTPSVPPTASPTPTATIAATPTPVPTATASPTPTQTAPPPGSFIGPEVAGLPTSGKAWDGLMTWAAKTASSPSIGDQDDPDNVIVLAQALVYARTGDAAMRSKVVTALDKVQTSNVGRALALGRELGAYVLAADYIGYRDPAFVSWVSRMRTVATSGGPASLVKCHEQRGNNWGTWCGASRVIADLYLGDSTDLAKAVDVWRGYLGDRAAYAGFSFGDTSWQADPSKPVAINPVGATKGGHSIDGVLPDDQRRGGGFTWPPPCENYVHEALQGVTLALAVLAEARTDLWPASGDAVFRAYSWLYANGCPASGDDTATPWIVNHYTGADFPVTSPTSPGKGFGFTDWLWP